MNIKRNYSENKYFHLLVVSDYMCEWGEFEIIDESQITLNRVIKKVDFIQSSVDLPDGKRYKIISLGVDFFEDYPSESLIFQEDSHIISIKHAKIGLTYLTTIVFPPNLSYINPDFFFCSQYLISVKINPSNKYFFTDVTGILYKRYPYELLFCPRNKKKAIIRETCTKIENYAFHFCKHLERIFIPASVNRLGKYSFGVCISLTHISFASNSRLTSIDQGALLQTAIRAIRIPSSVRIIEKSNFAFSNNLKIIRFPEDSQIKKLGNFKSKSIKFIYPNHLASLFQKKGLKK